MFDGIIRVAENLPPSVTEAIEALAQRRNKEEFIIQLRLERGLNARQCLNCQTEISEKRFKRVPQTLYCETCGSTCAECGDKIPIERQQAVPNTRLCVSCKAKQEK